MSQIVDLTHDFATDLWDWPLQHEDGVVHVHNGHDCWEVALDAAFFRPGEIEVHLSGDDHLFIYCRHEERMDEHGWVKRELHRSYKVPEDVDPGTIRSHFTRNGILQLKALKKNASRRSSIDVKVVAEEEPPKKMPPKKYGAAAIEKPGKRVVVAVEEEENAKNEKRQWSPRQSIFAAAENFWSPHQMPLGPFGWSWYNAALIGKSC